MRSLLDKYGDFVHVSLSPKIPSATAESTGIAVGWTFALFDTSRH